ncbi:hypothetical protein AcW1_007170 [Taiwanofungus camphoratus]|nr:hypothetical protein AcW2_007762 [Antrodia cinnamomea]KAI0952775.1 hypothetical protein AcW1_007170 [Antrodia cinnamomea]
MVVFPSEVLSQIVRYASPQDILTLCRTSKTLQRVAEAKLYECLTLHDAQTALEACQSLTAHDGLRGGYVRRFHFQLDSRRVVQRSTSLPYEFWQTVQSALTTMINLESILLHDPTYTNTWILNSPEIKFQLREAVLWLIWDVNVVTFLQSQNRLRMLHTMDSTEDGPPCSIAAGKLQSLEIFDGPLLVLAELIACPLTHVQVSLQEDTVPILPTVITDLGKVRRTLRSLNIVYLPEQLMLETLQLVSTSIFAQSLRHLGIIPLPIQQRHEVHRCLMRLHALDSIDVDVTYWEPRLTEPFQRTIAAELRIYCPSLSCVCFWISHHHFLWQCQDDEWTSTHFPNRFPSTELFWRNA